MEIFFAIAKFFKYLWKSLFVTDKDVFKPPLSKIPFSEYPGGPPEPRSLFKPPTPPLKPEVPGLVEPKRFIFVEEPNVVSFDFYKYDGTIQKICGIRTEVVNTGLPCPSDYIKVRLFVGPTTNWPFDFVNREAGQIGLIQNNAILKNETVLFVLEPDKILTDILRDEKIHFEVKVILGNRVVQNYPLAREEIDKLFKL